MSHYWKTPVLIFSLLSNAIGTAPSVKTGWDARWSSSECSAQCGSGTRTMTVMCMKDWQHMSDDNCQGSKPAETEPCSVECKYVNPVTGDDKNSGSLDAPLQSVQACVLLAGDTRDDSAPVTRCLLAGGRYTETGIVVGGRHRLVIEPENAASPVVFDGTDPLQVSWAAHSRLSGVRTSPVNPAVPRLEALIVGSAALQRSVDFETAVQPCFYYTASKGDDSVPQTFACEDAEAYFSPTGTTDGNDFQSPPGFWLDGNGALHSVVAEGAPEPAVRVKIDARSVAFKADGKVIERLRIRGLHFFGSTVQLGSPTDKKKVHSDVRIERCRFLYHPGKVNVATTGKSGRGSGQRIEFTSNVLEFGEGALSYKASAAKLAGNLFVGNSLAVRGPFSVNGLSYRDSLENNTFLYNGDHGGHYGWAKGHVARFNLWVGQSYLSKWHDSAVHHVQISSQEDFICEHNWILGPSMIKSVRLDTSKTATEGGEKSIVRFNVFLGHDKMTFKGDKHLVEHNTGDRINFVEAWGAIDNHNTQTWSRYNAVPDYTARGSTKANDAVPGFASLNACSNLVKCNPDNSSLPSWAAAQFFLGGPKQLGSDICSEVVACHPDGKNTYEQQRSSLKSTQPSQLQPLLHSQIRELDFRPRDSSASLVLNCGDDSGCTGDGLVNGFGSEGQPQGWSQYIGAYRPGGEKFVAPGCWHAAGCRRDVFPMPTPSGAVPTLSPAKLSTIAPKASKMVTLTISIKNVEFSKLDEASKESLVAALKKTIAEQAGVPQSAVSVTLSSGSVVIDAQIQVPEGTPASSVQTAVQEGDVSAKVLTAAKNIPGVQDAATGDIEVTDMKVDVVTIEGTKENSPSPAPSPPSTTVAPQGEVSVTTSQTGVTTTAAADVASGSWQIGVLECNYLLVVTALLGGCSW